MIWCPPPPQLCTSFYSISSTSCPHSPPPPNTSSCYFAPAVVCTHPHVNYWIHFTDTRLLFLSDLNEHEGPGRGRVVACLPVMQPVSSAAVGCRKHTAEEFNAQKLSYVRGGHGGFLSAWADYCSSANPLVALMSFWHPVCSLLHVSTSNQPYKSWITCKQSRCITQYVSYIKSNPLNSAPLTILWSLGFPWSGSQKGIYRGQKWCGRSIRRGWSGRDSEPLDCRYWPTCTVEGVMPIMQIPLPSFQGNCASVVAWGLHCWTNPSQSIFVPHCYHRDDGDQTNPNESQAVPNECAQSSVCDTNKKSIKGRILSLSYSGSYLIPFLTKERTNRYILSKHQLFTKPEIIWEQLPKDELQL